ncbi:MAG: T9SS type A sorting domain-containing protein [Flavobacteriales bacterium]|nr:T9SS type A sorting domain-containing protein [Flavobacteriales bacterium]
MHVYPNPATDLLRVEFPTGTFQNTTYVVRDVLGQEVIGGRLNGSKQVMISDLEDGSYTIELVGKETRSVARFVKQ